MPRRPPTQATVFSPANNPPPDRTQHQNPHAHAIPGKTIADARAYSKPRRKPRSHHQKKTTHRNHRPWQDQACQGHSTTAAKQGGCAHRQPLPHRDFDKATAMRPDARDTRRKRGFKQAPNSHIQLGTNVSNAKPRRRHGPDTSRQPTRSSAAKQRKARRRRKPRGRVVGRNWCLLSDVRHVP